MRSLYKSMFFVGVLILTSGLVVAGGAEEEEVKTFRLASVVTPAHHRHQALEHFADRVNELTDGSLEIRIVHSGQLGGERGYIEDVRDGTLEMATPSAGPIAGFIPEFDMFGLPYLFENSEHFWSVVGGDVGQEFLEKLEAINIKGLFMHDDGTRNVINVKRPIYEPEDLDGIQIRVMEASVFMDSLEAMGAVPVPMGYTEVYSGMEAGVIDGAENTLNNILDENYHEVADYVSITDHMRVPNPVIMNLDLYNSLTEDEQNAIRQAAADSVERNKELVAEFQQDSLEELENEGAQVNEANIGAFVDATAEVREEYAEELGVTDILEEIERLSP